MAKNLLQSLIQDNVGVQVDVFLSGGSFGEKDIRTHAQLSSQLGQGIVRDHTLDTQFIHAMLDELKPGQCQMLFIENSHVITVARDTEKLWIFDTNLNPDKQPPNEKYRASMNSLVLQTTRKLEPYLFTDTPDKYVSGDLAESLLASYVNKLKTQPVLVSPR